MIALKNGETGEVTVQYTPLVASDKHEANFPITLRGGGAGFELTISLSGIGVSTGLSVAPTTLDFGCVPTLVAVPLFITLANGANAPIHLTADPIV